MKDSKKNRFTYWFDNQMAGGTMALIRLLVIVAVGAVFVVGMLVAIFGAKLGYGFGSGIWIALTHLIDPGTVAGDDISHVAFILCMVVVTFLGIFITSTLTGVICNVIDEKVQDLRRGRSVVVENGHVIVLGTAGGLYTIISELIEANSNHTGEAVVIMDNKDPKDVMDEKINERFPDKKTTRIVCRSGNITDMTDVRVCSFDTCRSVIINAENDETTLKAILVVTRLLKEYHNDKAYITAVIRNEQNKDAVELAGEGYVEVLSYQDVMSRIIAHTGRYAGLSAVYTELFDMDGCELYIEKHPEAAGKTLAELNRYFPLSTVVGFVKADGELLLNPEKELRAGPNDRLIILAEDDGTSHMEPSMATIREETIRKEYCKEAPEKIDMLVLGYSDKLRHILEEEDHYVAAGSRITIALPDEQIHQKEEIEGLTFENIEMEIVNRDIWDREQLEALIRPEMKVLVLADDEEDMDVDTAEKKDAKILLILLQLRYLSEARGYHLNVTSEMLRVENQKLAQVANVNDFVISNNLTSLIVTQVSQSRELKAIFEELLREEGSEIYVRPARNYIVTGQPVDYYTACESAARQREVLIGYRLLNGESGNMEIVINPPKATEMTFRDTDSFIVIAVD